jgi:hypothetical protein
MRSVSPGSLETIGVELSKEQKDVDNEKLCEVG